MFYMDKSNEFSLQSVHGTPCDTAELRAAEPKIALLRANHLSEGLHSCTAQQGDSDLRDGMIPHVVERHGLTLTHVE